MSEDRVPRDFPSPEALADVFPVSYWQQDMVRRPDFRGREQRCLKKGGWGVFILSTGTHSIHLNTSQQSTIQNIFNLHMAYGHTSLFLLTCALPFSKANAHNLQTPWLHHASTILNPFYYQLMHITLKNAELL